jgi:uncharacterized membrane protein
VFVFLFLLTSVFSKYYDLMNPCFVYYFSLIQLLYIQERALRYVNKLYILEKSNITQGVIHVFGFFFLRYLLFIYVTQPVTQVQSTSCGCKVLEKKYNNY